MAIIKTTAHPSIGGNGFPHSRRLIVIYRCFVLGVGFGCSDWQLFRVNNVGPRSVLVSGVPLGGGFNHIFSRETADRPYMATGATGNISLKNKNASLKISGGANSRP